MKLSVDISMYPLQEEHIAKIDDFLADLNTQTDFIDIRTSNMSTRLFGEYQAVIDLLSAAMQRSMQKYGKVVFVCKFIEGDARELDDRDTITSR